MALEVLVDYQTKEIYPEHGPNLMWNLNYGQIGNGGTSHGPGEAAESG